MNDPYKILGIPPTATDDAVKQAYRELVKKYHPDNYAGSPLADLAGEKMAEINAAYDLILQQRKNGGGAPGYSQSSGNGYSQTGEFADVRRLISMGRIFEAEEILNGVAAQKRSAEWHFLKGSCLYRRGFIEDALDYFQTACNMDPQNPEYRSARDILLRQRQYGYGGPVSGGVTFCTPCGICSTLLCADCTCSMCRCCC